jgi:hypothetical protein
VKAVKRRFQPRLTVFNPPSAQEKKEKKKKKEERKTEKKKKKERSVRWVGHEIVN